MKIAEDFRRIARNALMNKWLIAVAVGLVASILGGISGGGPEFKVNIDGSNISMNFNVAGQTIKSIGTNGGVDSEVGAIILASLPIIIIASLFAAVIYFVLGSFIGVGYAKFNLNLVDKKNAAFETLFEYFSHWKTTTIARLLRALYVFLWSLLFIIPGIVAGFSYAMTDYILAEDPELTADEAISQSKSIMMGNKWRFFCLQFSFIGWDILATLAFGIGHLWLTPYKQATYAAFYREVSGTEFYYEETEMNANY
ncbi:MAG: DUF975 family protein [Clostridia bacterium]|nr:DUF975 family protein [Clostridia bacterium]